jgi:FkbM family methyltransferase
MEIYSQNNEQIIISDFFSSKEISLSSISFLDIGANDGITLSNTHFLALNNSKGICVEASPSVFPLLSNIYAVNNNISCINVAIGNTNGVLKFYESGELLGKGDKSLVSTLKVEELKRWESLNIPFVEVPVNCITFDKLIEMSPIKKFDFVSIDIEGMELEILPQINFNELNTKLICIENNGKDEDKFDSIIKPFGFELIHKNGENLIYAKSDFLKSEYSILEQNKCNNGHSINGIIPDIYDESSDNKVCDC